MTLEQALDGLADAKSRLRSRQAITQMPLMSEHMDRLAQFTSAVEDHLAELEEELEIEEATHYKQFLEEGKSVSASEKAAKYEVAKLKGQIRKLTRYVNSAWKIVDEKRSRWNHLKAETENQV